MKSFLPIGSVVALKGGGCDLMIGGRLQVSPQRDRIYDYCACPHPYGNMAESQVLFFDEEDIQQVVFRGYADEEEERMLVTLHAFDAFFTENEGKKELSQLLDEWENMSA